MVIQSRATPPDWTDDAGGGLDKARCIQFPMTRDEDGLVRNDAWFQSAREALPICNGDYEDSACPLRRSCLLMALINNDRDGVWGGMTGPQRRWIRRNVPKDRWTDDVHLRDIVPEPDYFSNLGDEDPDQDEADFKAEQEELRAQKRSQA